MKVSYDRKKKEAVFRMKIIGLAVNLIRDFDSGCHIHMYDSDGHWFGMLSREDLTRVEKFEREYNALVYAVIRNHTALGTLDSYLFVSDYPQDWQNDWQDLKNKETTAYVYNHDAPELSEIGAIGLDVGAYGVLSRTW